MVKLRPKLSVINDVRYRRPPRYNLERLKQSDVANAYAQHLEAALPDEGKLDMAPLEDCWRTVKAAINDAAESVVGYVERSSRKDWFDDGRSTTDQIFSVRQILQKCREYQIPTHHLFIDFKAAYDSIDRVELWKIMDENSFPGKLTRLIRATMDGVQNCVKISGEHSSSFESRRGLRQGDGLSCLLFNIALEGVMRRAGLKI